MNAAELAAYIGAAAWLPQIVTWIYRRFVRAAITVVPDRYAEVGFTSFGPIFNVRMAFAADRKDAIIDGLELLLRHEDGETRRVRWSGLLETFSEITDSAGNRQVVSRDQNPIALKIGTESLVEKFVRFQEPRYHESLRPPMNSLMAHFSFLKRSGDPDYVQKALVSKELYELVDARRKSFWWRAGRYDVTLKLSSPKRFSLPHSRYAFKLTSAAVDDLKAEHSASRDGDSKRHQVEYPRLQGSP